jgi:hypothetical protein
MISLTRIVEQQGLEGQYYDLGKDFAMFRRTMDSSGEQIKQKFDQSIGSKLVGKRIRARASRGYKQYVKDYEFDVSKVTIDDYYDNYVVVAHDNSTPKPKEYFLKPGFKILVLGPATGQPSPQKGDKPQVPLTPAPQPISPKEDPDKAQSQPMIQAPAGRTPAEEPVTEDKGLFDAYPIDSIVEDIKRWLPEVMLKKDTAPRDFVKKLGWQKDLGRGTSVALFDIKLPVDMVNPNLNLKIVSDMLSKVSVPVGQVKYEAVKMEPNEEKTDWLLRIKKTMTDKGV